MLYIIYAVSFAIYFLQCSIVKHNFFKHYQKLEEMPVHQFHCRRNQSVNLHINATFSLSMLLCAKL